MSKSRGTHFSGTDPDLFPIFRHAVFPAQHAPAPHPLLRTFAVPTDRHRPV